MPQTQRARRRQQQPQALHHLVEEAQRRGYLTIEDDKITYHCSRRYRDNWNDPEEKIRARTYAWLIIEKGYLPDRIDLEVTVPRRTPSDYADIVLYSDDRCQQPFLVVENKPERATNSEKRQGIEQGFGNTNSLRAPYMLYDSGGESILYDVANFPPTERGRNRLGTRDALTPNYGTPSQFLLVAGTTSDITPVSSAELETKVRRAHALIWSGGRREGINQ